MDLNLIIFISFILLIGHIFLNVDLRLGVLSKSKFEWFLDTSNLFIQGIIIPLVQTFLISYVFVLLFSSYQGILDLNPVASFLLNFVFVDYLYYWNHRLFHHKNLWPLHLVHHTMERFDVIATSRNTLWSSFFIIYLWVNGLFIFLLKDSFYFVLAICVTASLDLWRHSNFFHPKLQRIFSKWFFLITPYDHSVHHSKNARNNFGANLNLFDKLHGTYLYKNTMEQNMGIFSKLSPFRQLLYPFERLEK